MKRKFFAIVVLLFGIICIENAFSETVNNDKNVTINFSYSEQGATIGQPFTINYTIMGGSGHYSNMFYMVYGVAEHTCIDTIYGELSEAVGSFIVIPTVGNFLEFEIHCTDSETGIHWDAHEWDIPCTPNNEISLSFLDLPDTCILDEEFSFSYIISGEYALKDAKIEVWEFVKDDIYPNYMFEQKIVAKSGLVTYSPKAGQALYIAISGIDINDQPFYMKTERIPVIGTPSYQPVTIKYEYESGNIQIGKPFTVNYEIIGGSGHYSNIYYMVYGVAEHTCLDDIIYEELSPEAMGSFTVIPIVGDSLEFEIHCTDSETGIHWDAHEWDIDCSPNIDISVDFSNLPEIVSINEPFTFSYSIYGDNEIEVAEITIWEFIKDDTYPDCLLEQSLEKNTGTITYIPKAGTELYIAIYGKDSANQPYYVKTHRIIISQENFLSNCLILPKSIKAIESEAFSFVKATKIYIPPNVEIIEKNAFINSNINTILGNCDAAENFAKENGFEYIPYILEK